MKDMETGNQFKKMVSQWDKAKIDALKPRSSRFPLTCGWESFFCSEQIGNL